MLREGVNGENSAECKLNLSMCTPVRLSGVPCGGGAEKGRVGLTDRRCFFKLRQVKLQV